MQAQAVVVHAGAGDEPDGNVLSRGEGTPSPALVSCKRLGASNQVQATMNFC